jgi:hypothetical protein
MPMRELFATVMVITAAAVAFIGSIIAGATGI